MAYRTLAPSLVAGLPQTKTYRLPATVLKVDSSAADAQLSDGSILRRLKVAGGVALVGASVEVEFNGAQAPVIYAQGGNTASGGVVGVASSASGGGGSGSGVSTSRLLTAGLGMYGGGDLSADRTFNVGQGDGITVAADTVAVDSTVVRTTRQIISGNGMTGGGALSADLTLNVGVANTGAVGLTAEADAIRLTSSSNPGAAASVLASDSNGYLRLVKLGMGTAPTYPLHILDTGIQARFSYDVSHYADIYVDSGGNMKLQPTGMLVLNAGGDAVVPNINYSGNIGLPTRKWLVLEVAELHAEILVAREKVVTIGGRFMVAAGGVLIGDCPASA